MVATAVMLRGRDRAWTSTALRSRNALRSAGPQSTGSLRVVGLERAVRIDRDRHGVPHIDAASESDAFFALGFCHAQDRLAQLMHLRSSARGTAAERLGPEALEADRLARLIDFRGLAERQWQNLPRSARHPLEAYASGVNARIDALEQGDAEGHPPPMRADAIESWRPQDSLALFKLFAWGLSTSIDASLVLTAGEVLGPLRRGAASPPRAESGHRGRTTAQ